MLKALVTDTFERQTLHVVRSLGRNGVRVTGVVGESDYTKYGNIGERSKYCVDHVVLPSIQDDPESFLSGLAALAGKHDVLIPVSTATVELVSRNLEMLQEIIEVPIPDYKTIMSARNKDDLLKTAMKNDIPVPETHFVSDLDEVNRLSGNVEYPLVIKARDEKGLVGVRYAIIHNESELVDRYMSLHRAQKYPMIQEYIPGTGLGFFSIFNRSNEPRAVFCHQRIRELPIAGGPSCFCKSIRDDKIIEYGTRLLEALGWYGVAMVEFRMDERDNVPKLMEVNPRFWGSLPLTTFSGVDFPWLLYKLALDGDIEPAFSYREGVKLRFLDMDLKAAEQHLLTRSGKLRFLGDFIGDLIDPTVHEGIISKDDPGPATLSSTILKYIRGMLRRIKESISGKVRGR